MYDDLDELTVNGLRVPINRYMAWCPDIFGDHKWTTISRIDKVKAIKYTFLICTREMPDGTRCPGSQYTAVVGRRLG